MTSPTPTPTVSDAARTFVGLTVAGDTSPMSLRAVATDTYQSCAIPTCGTPADLEQGDHAVTVYTLTEPALPWWSTVEIHFCGIGHGELVARPTAAVLQPVPRTGTRAPTDPRVFEIVSIDRRHRSVLETFGTGIAQYCVRCRRPQGLAWYELPGNVRAAIPPWFTHWLVLVVHWCEGCGYGEIRHYSSTCLAEAVAPVADRGRR
ncbi:hypothetical protein [Nocardia sp. BMG111209]|uniref:hypothetical protein n=1 Tax=Nocardia sp. BMG111209 TaxID=1160137 RepID=UPI0003637E0D|nr:hypothetical protein [Nocardia sp. BMG111209]